MYLLCGARVSYVKSILIRTLFTRLDSQQVTEVVSWCQLFTTNLNIASPAKAKQNQPATSWCASVRRKIPPASDATIMKSQVKLRIPDDSSLSLPLLRPC